MDTERWSRVEQLFEAALNKPLHARAAFLTHACDDEAVRAEVEALLAADQHAGAFFEAMAQEAIAGALDPEAHTSKTVEDGQRIGPYQVMGKLGQGGMGTVYLAERADGHYEQQVAIKLLRQTDDPEHAQRFLAERQILAHLSHPNIARLLDGGLTEDGHPFLVMEYVDGLPLRTYCTEHHLNLRQRLTLFGAVCEAVAYAHRNLVVHRDLKPSNILVTQDGQVKLLDFGIAKLLDRPDATATATDRNVMTPAYASPEQVRGQAITTASDVYQLGVLLYELLTGGRPFDATNKAAHAVAQAILEDEPTPPSTIVAQLDPSTLPATGFTDHTSLYQQLIGDLDAIVLMALRKEAHRRYSSVEAFKDDLRRYQDGFPVRAREGARWYRTQRWLQRHRWGFAATCVAILALVGFATLYTVRVTQARDAARAEAQKAQQVTDLLVSFFAVPERSQVQSDTLTTRDLLDRGRARVAEELQDQPETQIALFDALGEAYFNLGYFSETEEIWLQRLRLAEPHYGRLHPATAEALYDLGRLGRQSRSPWATAYIRRGLAVYRQLPDTEAYLSQRIGSHQNLADIYIYTEQADSAAFALRAAQALQAAQEVTTSQDIIDLNNELARLYRLQGRYPEAESLYTALLEQHLAAVEAPDLHTSVLYNNLAYLHRTQERYDEAIAMYEAALEPLRRLAGPGHPNTLMVMNNLVSAQHLAGHAQAAETTLRDVLARIEQHWEPNHWRLAGAHEALCAFLLMEDAQARVGPHCEAAVTTFRLSLHADHAWTARAESYWAAALRIRGRLEEAAALDAHSLPILRREGQTELSGGLPVLVSDLVKVYQYHGLDEAAVPYRTLLPPDTISTR